MFGGEASGSARKEGDATAPDSATRSIDCSVALPRTLCADPHMLPMRALGHRGNRRFGLLCHGCIRRAPVDQPFAPVRSDTLYETDPMTASTRQAPRIYTGPQTPVPAVQLLSNGRYHVMLTSAGGGYSRWDALALTRWHDDATRDNHGSFVYLRDADSDALWSVAHQPTLLRGRFLRRPRALLACRPRHRNTDRNRRRRRRRGSAARPRHQPLGRQPHHRADQLRRSGAGAGADRRRAPGLQQVVRADRNRRRTACDIGDAPRQQTGRRHALPVPHAVAVAGAGG